MATEEKSDRERAFEEERKLFEREMAGVRPIRSGGPEVIFERSPASFPKRSSVDNGRVPTKLTIEEKDGKVWGQAAGVSEVTMRKLAKGEFVVSATCNLHGYHVEPAQRRVLGFLAESQALGRHVVLVVCGRGLHSGPLPPVLRQATLEVLGKAMGHGSVLAVVSAPSVLGGEGALLVMLRRKP